MDNVRNCRRRFLVGVKRAQRAFTQMETTAISLRDKQTVSCGLFSVAFSAYEKNISDLFILYALGHNSLSGIQPRRYISPRNRLHIESIMKAGQTHLFWADAGKVIERAGDWFEDGFIIGDALRSGKNTLDKSRKIRNYIAHRSDDAWSQFSGVWLSDIGPLPPGQAHPGEFLLKRKGRRAAATMFDRYTSELVNIFDQACGR